MGYTITMRKYELRVYALTNGKPPFQEWLDGLRDTVAKRKLNARLARASYGNFGDAKLIQGVQGLFEMREHYGAGYRIFYSVRGDQVVLLLAGSSKRDQERTIAKAKEYLADYAKRSEDNDK